MSKTAPADDWRAGEDLHHLTKAHEIKSDPKRHKAAMALAKSKLDAMRAVADPDMDGDTKKNDTDKDGK